MGQKHDIEPFSKSANRLRVYSIVRQQQTVNCGCNALYYSKQYIYSL